VSLSLYTAPAAEPLTLDEAKKQVHAEGTTDDDAWLEDIGIPAARDRAEAETGRVFITQVWTLWLDRWPCDGDYIEIPKPPLVDVVSISYFDQNGATQTWSASNYDVDAPAGPRCQRGRVSLAYNASWPTVRSQMNAVAIWFTAGYGETGAAVPPLLKAAMLMDLATLYANRENYVTGTIVSALPGRSREIYQTFRSHSRKR
jgi:uncharacterized phiE125 gp8 family phage protein